MRSVSTTSPRTARCTVSMVMLSHMPKKFSMKAMVASMPTAGSRGMLWYTTSSVKYGRSASAFRPSNASQNARTIRSASSALPTAHLRVGRSPQASERPTGRLGDTHEDRAAPCRPRADHPVASVRPPSSAPASWSPTVAASSSRSTSSDRKLHRRSSAERQSNQYTVRHPTGRHRRTTAFRRPHRGQTTRTPANSSHQLQNPRLRVMTSSWTPGRTRSLHRVSPVRTVDRSGPPAIAGSTFRRVPPSDPDHPTVATRSVAERRGGRGRAGPTRIAGRAAGGASRRW